MSKKNDYTYEEIQRMFSGADIGTFVEKNDLEDILMNEVADEMEKILLAHIESDIYGAYTPHPFEWGWGKEPVGFVRIGTDHTTSKKIRYQRRGTLRNRSNIVKKVIDGNTAFVTSNAEPNQSVINGAWVPYGDGAFLQMVSTHPGKIWRGGFARPALQNAQAEVDTSGAVQKAFERGLQRLGY